MLGWPLKPFENNLYIGSPIKAIWECIKYPRGLPSMVERLRAEGLRFLVTDHRKDYVAFCFGGEGLRGRSGAQQKQGLKMRLRHTWLNKYHTPKSNMSVWGPMQ